MGYVRNNYGCHCFYGDSAFKRYNRAAIGDTVIFNYNSGNTINTCCGGHRGGGFWGGIGMGLGMGLGNLFSGLLGGGNMFGGMGNLFGMGGGMSPWSAGFGFGNWGLGGGTPAGAAAKTNKTAKNNTKVVEKYKDDIDHAKINKLSGKVKALAEQAKTAKGVTPEEVAALNKELDDAVIASDDNAKPLDQGTYKNLKGILDTIATKAAAAPAKANAPAATQQAGNNQPAAVAKANETNAADALDADGFTAAQNDELNKLAKDPAATKEIAKQLGITPSELIDLKKLGCFFVNIGEINNAGKDVWALSLPKDLSAENLTKLKEIAGGKNIPVACGVNLDSTDKFIAGNIAKVDSTNGLTFTINARPVKAKGAARHGLKYKVTHKQNNEYEIREIDKTNKKAVYTLEAVEIGGTYLNRKGAPLIKDEDIVQ